MKGKFIIQKELKIEAPINKVWEIIPKVLQIGMASS